MKRPLAAILLCAFCFPSAWSAAFVDVTTAVDSNVSLSINVPAGAAENDVLIASIGWSGGTGLTVTPPSGWTLVAREDEGTSVGHATYWKAVTASEPASHTFGISVKARVGGSIVAVSGVDTSAPIDDTSGLNAAGTTSLALPSVTTTYDTSFLLASMTAQRSGTTITAPSGMTPHANDVDSGGGNGGIVLEAAGQQVASAGSTGTKTFVLSTSRDAAGVLMALAPVRVAFSSGSASGSEATASPTITVALSGASSQAVSVDYAVSAGTATGSGTDYSLGGSGTLTFAAGTTSQTIPLTIVADSLGEADETVSLTLTSPSNAALGSQTTFTYTITDDDERFVMAADPVASDGSAQSGANWGAWAAQPGASNVAGSNYVKITSNTEISGQNIILDFTPNVLTGTTTGTETIDIDGNIQFAWFEDTDPSTTEPNEGTFTFGSTSASGSVTVTVTGLSNVVYVQYRLVSLSGPLSEQAYEAGFTVSGV